MYIAIDIGGTKTHIASFKSLDPKSMIGEIAYPTEQNFKKGYTLLVSHIEKLKGRGKLAGIGVAVAALIRNSSVLMATNLRDWEGEKLYIKLKEKFKTQVLMRQDSECSGLAEAAFGKIRNYNRMLHITLGTGLGNSFIWSDHGSFEAIPMEMGEMIIEPEGKKHNRYKTRGFLESYVSGANLELNVNKKLSMLSNNDKTWDMVAKYLAIGIHNVVILLRPEVVVLGGGMIEKRPQLLPKVKKEIEKYKESLIDIPKVLKTSVNGNTALLGTLVLFKK